MRAIFLVKNYSLLFSASQTIVNGMTERKNFDIPIHLLSNQTDADWKPRKAQDPEEIARRKALRPGTLRYQQQAQGVDVSTAIYSFPFTDPESRQFSRDWMAAPLFNAAWYMYANEKTTPDIVMRRTLSLARLATDIGGKKRVTSEEVDQMTHTKLALSSARAHAFAVNYYHGSETIDHHRKLGRALGDTAMMLTAGHLDSPEDESAATIQNIVFLEATKLQAAAALSHERIGVHASVAQLSDPLSPLSVAWRRQAPPEARHALAEAQEVFGIPE